MKWVITILIQCFIISALLAQNEASVWYFGDHAGLDFRSGQPQLLINSSMYAEAGCAVISDKNGGLLFYTNGKQVWNRNHERMPNGSGLNGSQLLNQNSIIVPLPDSDSIYYLFTINANYDSIGMNYSVINMSRENGLGDLTLTNQLMHRGFVEKIAATEHCNNRDIWIVSHNRADAFYSYLLTPDGIFEDTIISKTGNYIKGDIGYMKISPSSNHIAFPLNYDSLLLEVFRFDNKTGAVSDPIQIFAKDETVYAYGLEFSPDGNLLYLTTGGKLYRLWQYDLTYQSVAQINLNAQLIAEGNHFAMQLAPDGKIYIAKRYRDYLSAINQPNNIGTDCEYIEYAVNLQGRGSLMGLPNFMASLFYEPGFKQKGTCFGDSTVFSYNQYLNSDSVSWDFGDGSPVQTYINNPKPVHVYKAIGTYPVRLTSYQCGKTEIVEKKVSIVPYPDLNLGRDTSICTSCYIQLDGGQGMDQWIWQDGSRDRFYNADQEGIYHVTVNKSGCQAADTIVISKNLMVLSMPNAFSPNNDGKNDIFKPVYSQTPVDYQMQIFDRNGRMLFLTNSVEHGWDGYFQGRIVMTGIYVYKITFSHFEENNLRQTNIKGTFVLVK